LLKTSACRPLARANKPCAAPCHFSCGSVALWKKTGAVPGRGLVFIYLKLFFLSWRRPAAVTVLFVQRPNQDAVVYLHRALAQLRALGEPIFLASDASRYRCRCIFARSPGYQSRNCSRLCSDAIFELIRSTFTRSSATHWPRFRSRLFSIGARKDFGLARWATSPPASKHGAGAASVSAVMQTDSSRNRDSR
jgi:hypothetical protein